MKEIISKITAAVISGEGEETQKYVQLALDNGFEPLDIINSSLVPGMNIVGEKFSSGEYFLPHLIMAAAAMQSAMALLEPEMKNRHQEVTSRGKVVIGTVSGDIHEIGKSLVGTMLAANGFQVYDLGVDVPAEKFVEKVKETQANLIGMSALLTTTMGVQRDVILALEAAGLREQVKVMVGGAPVSKEWAEKIGADGYAEDAIGAVQLACRLV
jgi:corrinoid protein of di/trimethylamine methyltransferase